MTEQTEERSIGKRANELNASYIIPSVFDPLVAPNVANAVRTAALDDPGRAPG